MIPIRQTKDNSWLLHVAGAVVCVSVSMMAYFVALKPLSQRRGLIDTQQQELVDRHQDLSRFNAANSGWEEQLVAMKQALAESEIHLESSDRVNRRIAVLTELAKDCGLTVDDIRLGKYLAGDDYEVVPIQLAGGGAFTNFARFLNQLSNKYPDTGLASFEVSGNPQLESSTEKFRFEVYWYTQPEAALQ